jgi:hypothetical protein
MPRGRSSAAESEGDEENPDSILVASPKFEYPSSVGELVARLRAWVWDALSDFYGEFWEDASSWLKWRLCDYLYALALMYW